MSETEKRRNEMEKLVEKLRRREFPCFPSADGELQLKAAALRKFDGAPWMFSGDRGRATLEGLCVRDVADCVVSALHRQGLNCDADAVAQSVCVLLEHLMGTYPNLKGVTR